MPILISAAVVFVVNMVAVALLVYGCAPAWVLAVATAVSWGAGGIGQAFETLRRCP